MATTGHRADEIRRLAAEQSGVVARRQLLELGLTAAQARAALDAGRWQSVLPGVYLTHRGALTPEGRVWAAVLAAGAGAVAGPRSTLWLNGLLDALPEVVDVWVPQSRHITAPAGILVHRRRGLPGDQHPAASLPQLRLERAVIEVARRARRPEAVVDVLICAVQRRRTTAERLRAEIAQDRAHSHRRLVLDVLTDVRDGVRSTLERRYLQGVERAHGLPRAERNVAVVSGGRRRYRDLRYRRYRVLVELDGREAHPDDERFRERERDNCSAVAGEVTLRYGWREVVGETCGVTTQVVEALRLGGWKGLPMPCCPTCPLG